MTTTPTTLDILREILASDYSLAPASLRAEVPLASLGIDSLGVAELLFNIEDRFGISLPAEPVALLTLGDVVAFIDGLLLARPAPPEALPATPPLAA